jgi:hypothetical protein
MALELAELELASAAMKGLAASALHDDDGGDAVATRTDRRNREI